MKPHHYHRRQIRRTTQALWLAGTAAATVSALPARAYNFDLGDSDWQLRWTHSLQYNLGIRTEDIDPALGKLREFDSSDYKFADAGDVVTNRISDLTQLNLTWQKRAGLRVSGEAWYDGAYDDDVKFNPGTTTDTTLGVPVPVPYSQYSSYSGNQYSSNTKRFYEQGAQLLDAFLFYNAVIGDTPVNFKVGRHTVYWGESLYNLIDSIAYAQAPIDLQKGVAVPGTQAKQIFLPLNQVSVQSQVSENLSLSAQYFLEWAASRYPEAGTYLGTASLIADGPDRFVAVPPSVLALASLPPELGTIPRAASLQPSNTGTYGISALWTPEWFGGSIGFYYRKLDEKTPWILGGPVNAIGVPSNYRLVYNDHAQLFGISVSHLVGDASVGAEVSYRRGTALNTVLLAPAGVRGDTLHAIVNVLYQQAHVLFADTLTYTAELGYQHLLDISSNEDYYNGVNHPGCVDINGTPGAGRKWDGCSTRDYVGTTINLKPEWINVFPSVNISAPITLSYGIYGNAATQLSQFGDFGENSGQYSFGVAFDIQQRYTVSLAYNDFFEHHTVGADGSIVQTNGNYLSDRGWVSLTLKTTF